MGGIFESKNELTNELFSDEFRKGDGARPAGLEVCYSKASESYRIAYILESPEEPASRGSKRIWYRKRGKLYNISYKS